MIATHGDRRAKVILAGGSGFVGVSLAHYLAEREYEVVILSRRPPKVGGPWRYVAWDARSLGDWRQELDGAAALVVMSSTRAQELGLTPLARIVGQATSGLPPKYLLMTPVEAVRRLAAKVGWKLEEVDLFEINEAFSVQLIAVLQQLGIDPEKVNVNGGAVALGHPIGASGARILTTLLYALQERGLKRGIASLCLGGGNGVALAVERV